MHVSWFVHYIFRYNDFHQLVLVTTWSTYRITVRLCYAKIRVLRVKVSMSQSLAIQALAWFVSKTAKNRDPERYSLLSLSLGNTGGKPKIHGKKQKVRSEVVLRIIEWIWCLTLEHLRHGDHYEKMFVLLSVYSFYCCLACWSGLVCRIYTFCLIKQAEEVWIIFCSINSFKTLL